MPGPDPDHWLHRLTAEEWLRAAANELAVAERSLAAKQRRAGVAGARRAAGMAWNAVLAVAPDERYGRSYMDHLNALSGEKAAPEEVRQAATQLLQAPLQTNVVALGRGDTRLADAARTILRHAQALVTPPASA